jgi:hypothetical protein
VHSFAEVSISIRDQQRGERYVAALIPVLWAGHIVESALCVDDEFGAARGTVWPVLALDPHRGGGGGRAAWEHGQRLVL